ncbi:MAG: hypothetical protein ACE5EZ_05980 [Thermodesulfobacteriota bacterium]
MSFSDYLELKVLDHVFGKAAYTMPTAYIGLSTADPLDTGVGLAEPVGGAYARVATSALDWNAAAAGATSNANALTFTQATGSWGTVSHFAVFDAPTAGNMLASGALTTPKAVGNGDTVKFDVGQLTATLD